MFSEPIVGEKFFGREEVLELLNKRVLALKDGYRQNVALTGQSLSGKSSIILHFLHTVNSGAFIPVYVEVVKEPFGSFANKFIATVLYNALKKMGRPVEVDMVKLMGLAQEAIPRTAQMVKSINSAIAGYDLDEAYMMLLGLTSMLKDEAGMSCVVILDEFDNLEHLGIKNPFLSFGKVIMVQKDTMYIVSSSRDEAIKKILSEKLSLLFGNFEVVKVSNFDTGTSSKFIDIKFANLEISESLKKFLIMFTDGNPFYLGKICQRAREIALESPSTCVDEAAIARAILELAYHANGVIHQYLMNFILTALDTKSRDYYLSILIAIAESQNTRQRIARFLKSKHGDVSKSLARLTELGLLAKNGVFYAIEDTMLAFWLKFVYQRRKALLVDGTFDRMDIFRMDIISYIALYTKECSRDITQRIADLFNQFAGELVSMDSRQIRLPHFTKVEALAMSDSAVMLAASFKGNSWVAQVYEKSVNETDIVNYIKNVKASGCKVSNKILIPLGDIDENAKLLAKELKIAIWDGPVVKNLLASYGMMRIITL